MPRAYPEGERIFHSDPRWLGGDAAVSVALGSGRVLWLFGDSFVDPAPPYARHEAAFVRNTAALQTGSDPRTAAMRFAWRGMDGRPAAFVPEDGADWFWPLGGLRLGNGKLVLFMERVRETADAPPLGFAVAGSALVVIDNPDAPMETWRMRRFDGPVTPSGAIPGAGVVQTGDEVLTLAVLPGARGASVVRYRVSDVAQGELRKGEWWVEGRGWVPTTALGASAPTVVIADMGAEASLQADACGRGYVQVSSRGFGATDIVLRTAPSPSGPWSAERFAFRPPESDTAAPFVYAGKAHAELATPAPGELILSYVASSLAPDTLLTPDGAELYWPRFALIAAPAC